MLRVAVGPPPTADRDEKARKAGTAVSRTMVTVPLFHQARDARETIRKKRKIVLPGGPPGAGQRSCRRPPNIRILMMVHSLSSEGAAACYGEQQHRNPRRPRA